MIDWLNPSDDVLDARSIGFAEGQQSRDEEVAALTTERDALAAELASQPLTGDGVRITSGMTVYRHITIRGRHEVQHSLPIRCWPLFQSLADGEPVIGPVMVNPELCYSSREAAEAAREAEKARGA